MRSVDTLLASYPPAVQALARDARRVILKLLPGIAEAADASAPVIGYNLGPGYRGMVCTLILSKTGVKLGLVGGAELDDPHGLLEGSGKVHRYVPLKSAKDLRQAGLNALVKAAAAACRRRLAAAVS